METTNSQVKSSMSYAASDEDIIILALCGGFADSGCFLRNRVSPSVLLPPPRPQDCLKRQEDGKTVVRKGGKSALDSSCACFSMSWCAEMRQEQI